MAMFESESRNNFARERDSPHRQTLVSSLQIQPLVSREGDREDDPPAALVSSYSAERGLFLLDDTSEILFQNIRLSCDGHETQSNLKGAQQLQLIGNITLHDTPAAAVTPASPATPATTPAVITEFYLLSPSSPSSELPGEPPKRPVLIIKMIPRSFPLELVSQWLRLVLLPNLRQCYLIDSLSLSRYISPMGHFYSGYNSSSANRLRVLFNNFVEGSEMQKYSAIPTLETGNIIDGISAALIGHCEVHSLSATLCVVLRETSYTREAAESLTTIFPQLSEFLEMELLETESWKEKSDLLHKQMIKKDQFLLRTSNMFI